MLVNMRVVVVATVVIGTVLVRSRRGRKRLSTSILRNTIAELAHGFDDLRSRGFCRIVFDFHFLNGIIDAHVHDARNFFDNVFDSGRARCAIHAFYAHVFMAKSLGDFCAFIARQALQLRQRNKVWVVV